MINKTDLKSQKQYRFKLGLYEYYISINNKKIDFSFKLVDLKNTSRFSAYSLEEVIQLTKLLVESNTKLNTLNSEVSNFVEDIDRRFPELSILN